MRSDSLGSTLEPKFWWLSIGLHVGIFLVFSVKATFFPSEAINIEGAIRVDVVDLPDKLPPSPVKPKPEAKPEAKKAAAKPKPKPKPKPNTVNLAKKRNAKMTDAIERARALQKIEDLLKEEESKAVAAAPVKGNQISKGSQLKGVHKLQYDDYIGELESHIRSHWSIPAWLANLELRASVHVKVTPEGFVKYKKIKKSSGNETYDDAVLATVDKASPFPRPSDKFRAILDSEGFVLGFPE